MCRRTFPVNFSGKTRRIATHNHSGKRCSVSKNNKYQFRQFWLRDNQNVISALFVCCDVIRLFWFPVNGPFFFQNVSISPENDSPSRVLFDFRRAFQVSNTTAHYISKLRRDIRRFCMHLVFEFAADGGRGDSSYGKTRIAHGLGDRIHRQGRRRKILLVHPIGGSLCASPWPTTTRSSPVGYANQFPRAACNRRRVGHVALFTSRSAAP